MAIRREFQIHPVVELIGIATISSDIEASIRRGIELAGMQAVLDDEMKRADTEENRRKIKDVSERDVGLDIKRVTSCLFYVLHSFSKLVILRVLRTTAD